MAPSPITKQFLTNSVAGQEMDKSSSFHSLSPTVSWALVNSFGPAADTTLRAGSTSGRRILPALTSGHQSRDEPELPSDSMTEAMMAQANLIAKSHPKADKLRRNGDGGAAQIRDAWGTLQAGMQDKQSTNFDPEQLAETRELFLSVSKKKQQQPHNGTNGQHQKDDLDGLDADQKLKTAWWGLVDAAKEMATAKASLAESMRLSQAAVAEVARVSSSVADHEEVLVRAQGEIVLRQQEIRRLNEHIKRLGAELSERDDAVHDARKAAHDARIAARDAEASSREKKAESNGDTPHAKRAAD
jgi:hypothetical protein